MGIHGKRECKERKIYQKINKKIKKNVDIKDKVWYINESNLQ